MAAPLVQLPPQGYQSYDGVLRTKYDDGITATIFTLGDENIDLSVSENKDIGTSIDSNTNSTMETAGAATGALSTQGPFLADRNMDQYINLHFGKRTNVRNTQFASLGTLYPNGSDPAQNFAWLYFDQMVVEGAFGIPGRQARCTLSRNGTIYDPYNVKGAASSFAGLAASSFEGLQGAGPSSFSGFSLNNGAASGAIGYDGLSRFKLTLDNGNKPNPTFSDSVDLLASGSIAGPIGGMLELQQLKGAAQPLPGHGVVSPIPLTLYIPTGNGAHVLAIHLSLSYMDANNSFRNLDVATFRPRYRIFSSSPVNATGTAKHGVFAIYN